MLLVHQWLPAIAPGPAAARGPGERRVVDLDTREIVGADGRRRKIGSRYEWRLLAALARAGEAVVEVETLTRAVYVEEAQRHGPDFLALAYDEPFRKVVQRARRRLDQAGYDGRATLENYREQGYRLHVN